MGATVSVECAVRVLPTERGMGYLLFENTYEKNCYPHTPHWSCVGAGYREDMVRRLFSLAAACEGGDLQGKGGHITPEAYLRRWQKACEDATLYCTTDRDMLIGKSDAPFNYDTEAEPIDASLGCPLDEEQVSAWNNGDAIPLKEERDFDKLVWLIRTGRLRSWRAFTLTPRAQPHPADLFEPCSGPSPELRLKPLVRLFEGDQTLFEVQADGTLKNVGWEYSYIGNFIRESAQTELDHPGRAIERFRKVRLHAKNAPVLGAECVLAPILDPDMERYEKERISKVEKAYPQGVALSQVLDHDRYHVSACMRHRMVAGTLPQFDLQAA